MGNELKDCVKSANGKTYCYDCSLKQYIEFVTKPIETKDIPLDVIDRWLQMRHDEDSEQ